MAVDRDGAAVRVEDELAVDAAGGHVTGAQEYLGLAAVGDLDGDVGPDLEAAAGSADGDLLAAERALQMGPPALVVAALVVLPDGGGTAASEFGIDVAAVFLHGETHVQTGLAPLVQDDLDEIGVGVLTTHGDVDLVAVAAGGLDADLTDQVGEDQLVGLEGMVALELAGQGRGGQQEDHQ